MSDPTASFPRLTGLARCASALLLALAGCSSATPGAAGGSSGGPPPAGDCGAMAAACLDNQQGCSMTATGPSCGACAAGTFATTGGACDPIPGTAITHDFPMQTIGEGGELLGLCRSWTLENDAELWVGAVELTQDESSHHSNWTYVPDTDFMGADGIWSCSDRGFDFYGGAAAGGVLFAQSTQSTHEVQKFPSGAAVRIPPHSRIISDIHLLNASSAPVTGHAHLSIYTFPVAEITTKLTVFHMEYDAIDIAPHSSVRYSADCGVASAVSAATGQPFAPKVYYALPHTHTLATAFSFKLMGGPNDGQKLLDIGSYNGEAHGRAFDPPIDAAGADGFSLACQYTNPRDASVHWGAGDQEMCEGFGWSDAPVFFQSRVSSQTAAGSDGDVALVGGPCDTVIIGK
jgi:hypothetical protein